ncbi:hypothetical protein [Chryseolinea lacunae]|uniref:hypothetical protein n=1 Tax=Chryseolinea lacunae TaxID=2801331 RepID=UPI001F1CDC14|nr:hypothetical protein [Chryseolinea lacunae]
MDTALAKPLGNISRRVHVRLSAGHIDLALKYGFRCTPSIGTALCINAIGAKPAQFILKKRFQTISSEHTGAFMAMPSKRHTTNKSAKQRKEGTLRANAVVKFEPVVLFVPPTLQLVFL